MATEGVGLPVGDVRLESVVPLAADEYLRELPVRRGEPLTEARLEESVGWLRAKEIFAAVAAETRLREGQVDVVFRVEPLQIVTSVEIRGERALEEAELRRRARIREEEPLDPDKTTAAAARLREFYADRGYPNAEVRVDDVLQGAAEVRVVIHVVEGEPIRVTRLEILDLEPAERREAHDALPFREGDVWTRERLAAGRQAIARRFRRSGYYEADVSASELVDGTSAELRYRVVRGPPIELRIEGNERLSREELLGLADLENRPIVTDGTWQLLAERIRERYRDEGFASAAVTLAVEGAEPKRVRFEIREGERAKVGRVRLSGVHGLDAGEVRRAMRTHPPSRLPLFGDAGWFRDSALDDDVEDLREGYRREGYLAAKVAEPKLAFRDGGRVIDVRIRVTEGPRTIVRDVSVVGAAGIFAPPLADLKLQRGAPLRSDWLEEDRRRLEGLLAARGYVEGRVAADVRRDDAGDAGSSAAVEYRIDAGEHAVIGRIVVQRNYFTRDEVIRRELPFRSGDPLDPAAMLEAQKRIYRLGLFRSVAIRPIQTTGTVRDVAVRVGERPLGEVQYGFGYNTRAGFRTFFQVGHRNILGTARQASLRGELNLAPANFVPDEYVVTLDGREPRFAASPYDLRANVTFQRSEREIDEFSIRRFAYATGFEREFLPGLQASFLVEFEDSDVFDVAPDAVLTGQDIGRLRTVSLNPIVLYDRRDDAFAPTRGTFETVRLRYGTPALGSEAHFLKGIAQHSHYVPLLRGVTWIYAARCGAALPLGDSSTIPLRERFFLGGRTTVRGFDENAIGPRGEAGNPVGGDLVINGNTEVRFPLFGGLGGAVFVDGGGLYLRERAVSLGGFRESAGPGLRYLTPIGAISFDYGFKIDRRDGESIGEWHFTIGNIF
jgi:outer membrane protein insertion porin family